MLLCPNSETTMCVTTGQRFARKKISESYPANEMNDTLTSRQVKAITHLSPQEPLLVLPADCPRPTLSCNAFSEQVIDFIKRGDKNHSRIMSTILKAIKLVSALSL